MITVLFDFADPNTADVWHAIDDRVMGGASRSRLRSAPAGHAVFEGEVSLERNGGFASVRSDPGKRGLHGAETCLIEVRGAPKPFKLSLLTDDGFDSLNDQASFTPAGSAWQPLHLPLAGFRATFRGRELLEGPGQQGLGILEAVTTAATKPFAGASGPPPARTCWQRPA